MKASLWRSAFANIVKVPELRRRILFTLAMLAVYRVGVFVTIPGVDRDRDAARRDQGRLGLVPRLVQHVLRRRARAALDLRARHHAVRLGVDHPAAAHGRRPDARRAQQGRRAGPAEDQPVHALRHDRAVAGPGVRSSRATLEGLNRSDGQSAPSSRTRAWASADDVLTLTTGTAFIMWLGEQITERGIGNGISLIIFAGIVAGIPDGDRRASSQKRREGDVEPLRPVHASSASSSAIDRGDRASSSAAQRQIPIQYAKRSRRPQDLRRADDAPAAQGQHRRRHPADLRVVAPDVPGAARELRAVAVDAEVRRRARAAATGSSTSSTSR